MKVIMALHPKHWEKIENGTKKYEFRRRGNMKISEIYIYLTAPQQKLVGKLTVKPIKSPINILWAKTKNYPGITFQAFLNYFAGKTEGYAFEIQKIEKYLPGIDPKNIPGWTVPQSYRKLHDNEIKLFDGRAN